uniref:Nucleoprotein n=1 Tax=Mothra virus TaxID=1892236 RepID=A0A1L4FLK0_9VIRU|nr:nucleoprotein [Mothra virus]
MAAYADSRVLRSFELTADELTGLFNELGITGATEADTSKKEAIAWSIDDPNWANNASIREAVAYLGFDAKAIFARFYELSQVQGQGANTVHSFLGGGGINLHPNFNLDLQLFINVFLQRGNNTSKIISKMDPQTGAALSAKFNQYAMRSGASDPRNPLRNNDLTLARIAQTFAAHTAAVIIHTNLSSKLTSRLFGNTPVPCLMLHSIFSALVPTTGMFTATLRNYAIVLNTEMSLLLADARRKRQLASETLRAQFESSERFVDAALNGSSVPNMVRMKILIKAGIIVPAAGGVAASLSAGVIAMGTRYTRIMTVVNSTMADALQNLGA